MEKEIFIMSNVNEFPKDVLLKEITQKGKTVEIRVYEDGEGGLLLEIVDEYWNSTCWDDSFETAQKAMDEGIMSIEKEGIETFIGKKDS